MLVDSKDRRYLVTLAEGGEFHSHAGLTRHDDILAAGEGASVRSRSGARYLVLRPTLADFVLAMPRRAQVVYPKDLGAILVRADIFPGAHVLEAGVGSGALSMALLRAGARVTGYEIRDDFAQRAQANVERMMGPSAAYDVVMADVYEGIGVDDLDRIVLDLPEPWQVVPHAESAMRTGGVLLSYLPSIIQVSQLCRALETSRFGLVETVEVLQRGWYVKGSAVRPDHRMVAHTGFLTTARLLAEGGNFERSQDVGGNGGNQPAAERGEDASGQRR